jgi:hypothetical protein
MRFVSAIFRTFAPRVIGAAAAATAGWIYAKTHGAIVLDQDATIKLVSGMLLTYAGAHRAASAVINPGDAANASLATAETHAVDNNTAVVPRGQ